MRVLSALVAAALAAAPAAAQQATLAVAATDLQSLEARLDRWAPTLPAAERALWSDLLRRAAAAPAAAGEVRVVPVVQIGPGGGCDTPETRDDARRVGILVQGGREAQLGTGMIVPGGRRTAAAPGVVQRGGRPGVPAARVPRPGNSCVVAIGPKQDDATPPPPHALGLRLAALARDLPEAEQGALNWLLTRAATPPAQGEENPRPGTPGGPRPVSLRAALGIDPLAIGPKQDDPAPPPPSRWVLRY
jgi:hypothetical protein